MMDNIPELKLDVASMIGRKPETVAAYNGRKSSRWAGVHLGWASQAGKVLNSAEQMVAIIHLIHWASLCGYPVEATTVKTGGVRLRVVHQALKLLEEANLVDVEWRKKRSPIVHELKDCQLLRPKGSKVA